jgi:hypothetical protein
MCIFDFMWPCDNTCICNIMSKLDTPCVNVIPGAYLILCEDVIIRVYVI